VQAGHGFVDEHSLPSLETTVPLLGVVLLDTGVHVGLAAWFPLTL
jgi:hypothetical protein